MILTFTKKENEHIERMIKFLKELLNNPLMTKLSIQKVKFDYQLWVSIKNNSIEKKDAHLVVNYFKIQLKSHKNELKNKNI